MTIDFGARSLMAGFEVVREPTEGAAAEILLETCP